MTAAPAFICALHAQRIVFGPGQVRLAGQEAGALGMRRAALVCTPGRRELAQRLSGLLGERLALRLDRAEMHVSQALVAQVLEEVRRSACDGIVAAGGGSATGLAKAIALQTGLPILAVPTTYSGSEATPVWGITENRQKQTGRDARVLPRTVVYDPELTADLPASLCIASALNALAHAAEGLYAADAHPVTDLMAEEGIRAIAGALPALAGAPAQARADLLYGAWLCGTVLGNVGMGLHHKVCHVLGGRFGLPHAATHAIVLPHVLAYNASHAPGAMQRIARALGNPHPAGAVHDLARALGAPTALAQLGLHERDVDEACDLLFDRPYPNPRPLDRPALRRMLQDAHAGTRPPAPGT